jgi:hypothetical protein
VTTTSHAGVRSLNTANNGRPLGIHMKDALDVATDDSELAREIALLTDVMVAVTQARGPLDQAAIDAILRSSSTSVGFGRVR